MKQARSRDFSINIFEIEQNRSDTMSNNLSNLRHRWFYCSVNVDSNIDRNGLGVNLLVLKDTNRSTCTHQREEESEAAWSN